jgi:hypothetical protein
MKPLLLPRLLSSSRVSPANLAIPCYLRKSILVQGTRPCQSLSSWENPAVSAASVEITEGNINEHLECEVFLPLESLARSSARARSKQCHRTRVDGAL